jgi:hypothetical protein
MLKHVVTGQLTPSAGRSEQLWFRPLDGHDKTRASIPSRDNSDARFKKLFLIDLDPATATDVSNMSGHDDLANARGT